MKKLILYGILCFALLLSVSCSNDAGSSESPSEPETPAPTQPANDNPPSSDTVKGTLTFISGGDIKIVADGTVFTATPTIPGEYTYEWYLNDVKQTSETNQCAIDTDALSVGFYKILVKATSSTGIVYVTEFEWAMIGQATV